MRMRSTILISAVCAVFAGFGCVPDDPGGDQQNDRAGNGTSPDGESPIAQHNALEYFESEEQFEAYMAELVEHADTTGGGGPADGEPIAGDADQGADAAPDGDAGGDADVDNEDITNTQEDDVDEGGIVKNVGDHLVVLRRGALYGVDVSESGQLEQTDAIRVAPDEELNQGVWYDEMLVRGNQIYVIGYRYDVDVVTDDGDDGFSPWMWFGATEVSSFVIDDDGQIERGETTFFESNDYYSGTNYASRLVDGELIFYKPYYVFIEDQDNPIPSIPRFLKHKEDNEFLPDGPLFGPTDIIEPPEKPTAPTFHTVVQCELPSDLSIDCSSRSLLAEPAREFYVSSSHIHLFGSGHVFAMAQTSGVAGAHATDGQPVDQFSFSEVDDELRVSVSRIDDSGADDDTPDWELPHNFEMLRLPLEDFDADGEQSLDTKSELIAEDVDRLWGMSHRHIGDWYVAADGDQLYAHDVKTADTTTIDLQGNATRVESAPGIGAIVVHDDFEDNELHIDSLRLGDGDPELVAGTDLDGMREGESRSHGFFFRPDESGGTFGLPVVDDGSGGAGWWGSAAANIGFFNAHPDGEIDFVGAVSSTDDAEGDCETSCIDWYGNTRPVFLHERVYALMGSEIAQVDIGDDDVDTIGSRVVLSTED